MKGLKTQPVTNIIKNILLQNQNILHTPNSELCFSREAG